MELRDVDRPLPANDQVLVRWTGLMLWWKPFNAADVATLKDLIAAGKLAPAIDRQYPLSGVVEALRYVDEGHAKGKVVITIASDKGANGP